MTIEMYDLAGADPQVRFSPYCWRIRMALAHKGLPVATIPWRFTDKDAIEFSGQGLVPVIRDGDRTVHDSWTIACYLDENYPDRPRLVEGRQAAALVSFLRNWTQIALHPLITRVILLDLHAALAEQDKAYFRQSREKRLGMSLEAFAADSESGKSAFRAALSPIRATLAGQPWIAGAKPAFADYVLFGAFQWARAVSRIELLEAGDAVHDWRERMLDLYDGLARHAPRA